MQKEERNYLTEENGAKIIQVTSEMSGCNVSNILLNETKVTIYSITTKTINQ